MRRRAAIAGALAVAGAGTALGVSLHGNRARLLSSGQVARAFAAQGLQLRPGARNAVTADGAITVEVRSETVTRGGDLVVTTTAGRSDRTGYAIVNNVVVAYATSPARVARVEAAVARLERESHSRAVERALPSPVRG